MSLKQTIKRFIPEDLFLRIVPIWHLAVAAVSHVAYRFPTRGMHFIGVTGTNGKTTPTNFIFTMLRESGIPTAYLSTTTYGVNKEIHQQIEHMTTVSPPQLQKRLADFKRKGAQWVVVETSSHALAQHRVWGIPYEIAVMSNITHEHLDYHKTFNKYREAKRKLFKMAARSQRSLGVVNAEDPAADLFARTTKRSISYGLNQGQITARDIKLTADGSTFMAISSTREYKIKLNIPGDFNVSNALSAIAVGEELKLTKQQIEHGLAALKAVEARMMKVDVGQDFSVIIDHAGTPDAFQRVFDNLRPIVKGRIITVFGSPAHRDRIKRPIQGEIAAKYSDEVILTEEDDRDEPSEQILGEIAAGAEKAGKVKDKDLFLIPNRTDAINFAMTRVKSKDDLVITLGKGHEKTIERGTDVLPWSEPKTVEKAIKKVM